MSGPAIIVAAATVLSHAVAPHAATAMQIRAFPRMSADAPDYEFQHAFAARVAREAGTLLADPTTPESAMADALQHLDFELSHEPAVSLRQARWVSHVDEHIVSIALVDREHGPVVGAVCRPWTNELITAQLDAGAYYQHGEGPATPTPQCGMASMYANIIHVPHDKCPELEVALDNLGEKMPLDVSRVPCCCCCEGLFELVCGRADVHLSPPDHFYLGQQRTPAPVLCAFEVLLLEAGGHMSDMSGDEIDLVKALSDGHTGGVLASASATHNYVLHATRKSFEAPQLSLPRLAETQRSDAVGLSEWGAASMTREGASRWTLKDFEARRSELGIEVDDLRSDRGDSDAD